MIKRICVCLFVMSCVLCEPRNDVKHHLENITAHAVATSIYVNYAKQLVECMPKELRWHGSQLVKRVQKEEKDARIRCTQAHEECSMGHTGPIYGHARAIYASQNKIYELVRELEYFRMCVKRKKQIRLYANSNAFV